MSEERSGRVTPEAAGAAGEHNEPLLAAVGTPDAGEPAAGIAAVEVALDHLLDNGPEEAALHRPHDFFSAGRVLAN